MPMQLILLFVTFLLSVVLYRLLSHSRATYPFVRITRVFRRDGQSEYITTEAEEGLITIDSERVIIDGHTYDTRPVKGRAAEASFTIEDGKLICITIALFNGEKQYHIDPDHSLFVNPYAENISRSPSHHVFSC